MLGVTRVPTARRGIRTAEALLRIGGAGHSAVIHSNDPRTVMEYAAAVDVLRVTVNEGGSTGSAGFSTNLAPSMTIGTGFVGRSSLGENLEPQHLVNLTRIAYSTDPAEVLPSFDGIVPVGRADRSRAGVPGGEQPGRVAAASTPPPTLRVTARRRSARSSAG